MQIQTFYNGSDGKNVMLVDAAAGEALMKKTIDESFNLLNEMALNDYKYPK